MSFDFPLLRISGSSSSSPRIDASSSRVTSTSRTCSPAPSPAFFPPSPSLSLLAADDGITWVAVPLTCPPLLFVAEAEARDVDLRDGDRHEVLPFPPDQLSLGDVLPEVLPDPAADDAAEARVVLVDLQGHLSPVYPDLRAGGRRDSGNDARRPRRRRVPTRADVAEWKERFARASVPTWIETRGEEDDLHVYATDPNGVVLEITAARDGVRARTFDAQGSRRVLDRWLEKRG